ncbi:MAG TPA: DUF488 domain-containing protein [Methanomicrobia archaeon]|nr:DUF488 domain-containing protein [Methanomicrobia archaeon]
MTLKVKRIYEQPAEDDGFRILVDRLWPRGLSKDKASVDLWLKDIAPSTELRKWFAHKEERWDEFKKRYFGELEGKHELLDAIREESVKGSVTLLYSAKNDTLNNAMALVSYIQTVNMGNKNEHNDNVIE